MNLKINEATQKFIDELKAREEVKSVILFGSWARGNQRPKSDVDLIVILNEGYKRVVETHYGQVFEIIYLTANSAVEYWSQHLDETARLWAIAKVLYDEDGTAERLQQKATELTAKGKPAIESPRLAQLQFDANDQLGYAKYVFNQGDVATANMIVSNKIFALAQLYFDIKQEWAPAPKQLLETIKDKNLQLYAQLNAFYSDNLDFNQKLTILEQVIKSVFA